MDCTIVDVFAERPLAGNQLAVVRECAHLSTAAMQAIALETNFSETTFVTAERDGEADVRIFTPAQELPFAGHPTLGTAWVLGRERGDYTLCLEAGRVPVRFGDDGIAWLTAPAVEPGAVLDLRRRRGTRRSPAGTHRHVPSTPLRARRRAGLRVHRATRP